MKKQDTKSADLVHRIRFNRLGEKQWVTAENFLRMTIRNWRSLRNGSKNFSSELHKRISVVLLVHRISPVGLYNSSPFSIGEHLSVTRAQSSDDLRENLDNIHRYLKCPTISNDYGLHGLLGAVNFAIWILESGLSRDNIDRCKGNNLEKFLVEAIKHWEIAAKLTQGVDSKTIIGKTFAINALTARIYREVFYTSNGEQKPNEENHRAYRDFAKDTGKVSSWRDALEQSALLGDSELINQDFRELLKSIEREGIVIEDEYEVVLKELRGIDGFPVLKREPAFTKWETKITLRYQEEKMRGVAA
ncbi:MAG: hypothetical protein V9H25_08330 [Candidatus Competibacter sp.]